MATLLLSAVGTLAGGPIGGALGALAGQQIDRAIIGSPHREGPRLKELAVTTSSYGTPIPRHFGRMRVPGTLIWATDLAESSESTGGKGQPTITTYSYSASFAVALSSRPILGVGRIWADGNLLRGEAGDLKTGGTMRVYDGYGDNSADPLIAADVSSGGGADCPAFRHTAYVVFEDLQLADFGNRLPALTFEIFADEGELALADMLASLGSRVQVARGLPGLAGFSLEGAFSDMLGALDPAWPMAVDAGADGLTLRAADAVPGDPPLLSQPALAREDDGFGANTGVRNSRGPGDAIVPDGLRYYDTARDYQSGVQRADGRARLGRGQVIELPASLAAADARILINAAAERAAAGRETMAWRLAELDPGLTPGTVVRAPGYPGLWRIVGWEWREQGVELDLLRLPRGPALQPVADAGSALPPHDRVASPTTLRAFELPWDGGGSGDAPAVFAAASSTGAGWTGAALYAERQGQLLPIGGSGSHRAIVGNTVGPLARSAALRLEADAAIDVELLAEDFALAGTDVAGLAMGANRALIGGEIVQFLDASALGGKIWRLSGLLRGRGGTEPAAWNGQAGGAPSCCSTASRLRSIRRASGPPPDCGSPRWGWSIPAPSLPKSPIRG